MEPPCSSRGDNKFQTEAGVRVVGCGENMGLSSTINEWLGYKRSQPFAPFTTISGTLVNSERQIPVEQFAFVALALRAVLSEWC